jgi:hypothetical protein
MALPLILQGALMAGRGLLTAGVGAGKALLTRGLAAEAGMGALMGATYGDPIGGAVSGVIGGGIGNVVGGGLAKIGAPGFIQNAGTMAGYMGGNLIGNTAVESFRPRDEAMQASTMRGVMSAPGANDYLKELYGRE